MRTLKMLKMKDKYMEPKSTGWAVSGLGLLVSTIGAKMLDKKVGAGVLGFGLAHLVLGQLDRFRPTIKKHSWY
ncbi:MAG: hypothetical protein ACOCQW_00285 [Halanaerobiaceae bacterium]